MSIRKGTKVAFTATTGSERTGIVVGHSKGAPTVPVRTADGWAGVVEESGCTIVDNSRRQRWGWRFAEALNGPTWVLLLWCFVVAVVWMAVVIAATLLLVGCGAELRGPVLEPTPEPAGLIPEEPGRYRLTGWADHYEGGLSTYVEVRVDGSVWFAGTFDLPGLTEPGYVPGRELPSCVVPSTDWTEAIDGPDVFAACLPPQIVPHVLWGPVWEGCIGSYLLHPETGAIVGVRENACTDEIRAAGLFAEVPGLGEIPCARWGVTSVERVTL